MDFVKNLINLLPVEWLSDTLAKIVFMWIRLVDGVPEDSLALYTYVSSSFLVLSLLVVALKVIPKSFRGIIWIIAAAILLTPGATINDTGGTAPAIIEVVHTLILGEIMLAVSAFLPIMAAMIVGLILGGIWYSLKAATLNSVHRNDIKS